MGNKIIKAKNIALILGTAAAFFCGLYFPSKNIAEKLKEEKIQFTKVDKERSRLIERLYQTVGGENRILSADKKRKFLDHFGFSNPIDERECLVLGGRGINYACDALQLKESIEVYLRTGSVETDRYIGEIPFGKAREYLNSQGNCPPSENTLKK